jgi:hypothetical protein
MLLKTGPNGIEDIYVGNDDDCCGGSRTSLIRSSPEERGKHEALK